MRGGAITANNARPHIMLGLADEPGSPLATDSWIGALVSLGSLLRRFVSKLNGRQLVLALSVPRRDYAAALIGSGWMLSSPAPELNEPIEVFRKADSHTYLRAVTDKIIATGVFARLDENRTDPRVITAGRILPVDRYKAVAVLDGCSPTIVENVPEPGFLATLTGAANTWLARIAAPPTDLALVGTAKWIRADLDACIGNGARGGIERTPLSRYVLPVTDKTATWATTIISATKLGEGDTVSKHCTAAILDRYGAIKYLNDITAPIVVCIIDRSVVDDRAAELVVQARISNSHPVSVTDDLCWRPPAGIEALAFTVAL